MERTEFKQWGGGDVARLLAVLENERRYYQEVLVTLPVAALTVSLENGIVFANPAMHNILKLRLDQLQHKSLTEVLVSPELQRTVESSLKSGTMKSHVQVTIRGQVYCASVSRVRSLEDGTGLEALIVFEEPSAEQRATLNLSLLPALTWSMNPDTRHFDWVEGGAQHFLGYSQEHWLNTPQFWLERAHPDYRGQVAEFYRAAMEQGGDFACEFRAMKADGEIIWLRDSFHIAMDSGGVTRIHGVTLDITGRRNAERDNVIAQRVEALVGLSRLISNDLNNALMIVTGYAEELLTHTAEGDPRRSDVQSILSAAESMANLAGELHGFTRKQAAKPVETEIGGLLTGVATRIREELGAALVVRQRHSNFTVLADAEQLEATLLSIARRLRDKTNPHMILSTGETRFAELAGLDHALKPGRYVEISMRGPYTGQLDSSAFENFLSGRSSHGSDLARGYAIVREWGGSILAGYIGHLSEIRIVLPLFAIQERKDRMAEAEGSAAEGKRALTVLLVEDEKGVRTLIRKILAREGCNVLEASNGEEALEVAHQQRASIDLLLTDVRLPGMNVRQLADTLGRRHPELRFLFMSGYEEGPEMCAVNNITGSAFLPKPFTLATLLSKVREIAENPIRPGSHLQ